MKGRLDIENERSTVDIVKMFRRDFTAAMLYRRNYTISDTIAKTVKEMSTLSRCFISMKLTGSSGYRKF